MSDRKYKRLFTESDVREMLREYLDANEDIDDVLTARSNGSPWTFPPDEPLFLLRGQDALAPHIVREYALLANDPSTVNEDHRKGAFMAADEMSEWQAQNPARVKVPD